MVSSCHFQSAHGCGAAGEAAGFDAEALQEGDVEVGQRIVLFRVKGEVLAVLETSASEQRGQVVVRVRIGAAHVGAVKYGGAVKQGAALFGDAAQTAEKGGEIAELRFLNAAQLAELLLAMPVVCELVRVRFHPGNHAGCDAAGACCPSPARGERGQTWRDCSSAGHCGR